VSNTANHEVWDGPEGVVRAAEALARRLDPYRPVDPNAERAHVAGVIGTYPNCTPSEGDRALLEGLRRVKKAGPDDLEIVWLELKLGPSFAEDSLDQMLALRLLDALIEGGFGTSDMSGIQMSTANRPWTTGIRLQVFKVLDEHVSRTTRRKWLRLACPQFAWLPDAHRRQAVEHLRSFATAAGIGVVVIHSVDSVRGVDSPVMLPRISSSQHQARVRKRLRESTQVHWRELIKLLSAESSTPTLHNLEWLDEMSNGLAAVMYPAEPNVDVIASRVSALAWNEKTEGAKQRTPGSRRQHSAAALGDLLKRAYFLLMLEQIEPRIIEQLLESRDGAVHLHRLQLVLSRQWDHTGASIGLLAKDWTGYLADSRIEHFGRLMLREGGVRVVPFPSSDALIQHADWVFGGALPYADDHVQGIWERWLEDLGAWCQDQHQNFVDRYNEQLRSRREGEGRRAASEKELRAAVAEARAWPLAPSPEAPDALVLRAWTAKVMPLVEDQWPIEMPKAPDAITSAPPELPISLAGYWKHTELLDPAARFLHYADLLWAGHSIGGDVGTSDADQQLARRMRDVRATVEELLHRLEAAALASSGSVHVEAALLQARALALLDRPDEAIVCLDRLQTGDDLTRLYVEFSCAYVEERRGDRYGALLKLRTIATQAEKVGAMELFLRCALAIARCEYASAARASRQAALLWAATALATLGAERSPRLARRIDKKHSVFVSYRQVDALRGTTSFVDTLKEAVGPDPDDILWVDTFEVENSSQDFSPMMLIALQSATAVVFLFSSSYFKSRWCTYELDTVLAMARQRMVAITWTYLEGGALNAPGGIATGEALRAKVKAAAANAIRSDGVDKEYFNDRVDRVFKAARSYCASVEEIAKFARENADR